MQIVIILNRFTFARALVFLLAIQLSSLLYASPDKLSDYPNRSYIKHPGNLELIELGSKYINGKKVQVVKAHSKILYSYEGVEGPSYFSLYLLEHTTINPGETVLDIGTGTGIQALFAADKAKSVVATDINANSLLNTQLNAKKHNVAHKIETRASDLFRNFGKNEKFDVITVSLPYPYKGKNSWAWELHERFFKNVDSHLKKNGRIYFLSGQLVNVPRLREIINQYGFEIMYINMAHMIKDELEMMVYTVQRQTDVAFKANVQ